MAAKPTSRLLSLLAHADARLYRRYVEIDGRVSRELLPFTTPEHFTDHGIKHARTVQTNLGRLLPRHMREPLTGFELFVLALAASLHDVGMILPVDPEERSAELRLTHYLRSYDFVTKRHEALGLTGHEAWIVGEVCRAHGMPDLRYLEGQLHSLTGHGTVRVPLLSALLRLADFLDLTADRAPELLASSRKIPESSERHWELHRSITDVKIESDPSWDLVIVAAPAKQPIEAALVDLRNAVQAELDTVSPILRAAGLYFKRVDLVLNKAASDKSDHKRSNPFLRLASFGQRDADLFAGRDDEISALIEQIMGRRVVVLIGESGVGKTSLVEAGVSPRLKGYGYAVVRFSLHRDPIGNLVKALRETRDPEGVEGPPPQADAPTDVVSEIQAIFSDGVRRRRRRRVSDTEHTPAMPPTRKEPKRLLIIGDHLEQMFTDKVGDTTRDLFIREMTRAFGHAWQGRLCFLFCIRQDFLPDLYDLSRDIPELYERANTFKLHRLDKARGLLVLQRAAQHANIGLSDTLVSRIIDDIAREGEGLIYPPYLQIVGFSLYSSAGRRGAIDIGPDNKIQESLYERLGRSEAIVNRYLDSLLDGFSKEDRPAVGKILESMVTEHRTKRRVTKEYLRTCIPECHNLGELLDKLVVSRIVRPSFSEFELMHDFLALRVVALIDSKVFLSRPVRLAIEFIEANYDNVNLTSRDVASAAGVSPIYLAALFRTQIRASLNRQLNSARTAAAKRLMSQGRDPLSIVATKAGFRSLSSFGRTFAEIEKVSPSEFRRNLLRSSPRRAGRSQASQRD